MRFGFSGTSKMSKHQQTIRIRFVAYVQFDLTFEHCINRFTELLYNLLL